MNSQGNVVGWAETAVHDPTCVDAQVLQFRAVLWDPKDGSKGKIKARELRPFHHDSASAASGSRAFIWQNGVLANLNDLVDIAPDVLVSAQDINDAGQITGRVRDGVTGRILTFVATPIAN